ncbi:MAG: branched-chain amino acid ABC transporter substrate-binding protein [Meiothermus sp.]|uniref:Branched-chain amino acid ABC transporter substrate-binding protein n=2 Tax=Meiothermus hypogaeus TaxID=884155 RepID=A0A511R0H5_9DEIN|nr:ABC transporter substrate-binding protein [Meiothermus hypogaeus]RIH77632.1 Leu/Ile/Val-binding protein [Meiothermus hypogaeus]GEM83118.1 branched-chain amino acid ABC transporter substrate-binding protein [Meiothermus hypogaeus NBRC 106114]GIW38281.1 MAG: branched-chain amino acid ABC transporter substrate-binding protein [Meiothermus sp.]
MKRVLVGLLALGLGLGLAQQAPLKIGVVVSATGPAASLGIPERNTLVLLEEQVNRRGGVAGRPVQFVIIDDASDTTQAVRATRRLVQEDQALAIIGTTTTPASLGMIDVVAEAGVPKISLAANLEIVFPVDEKRRWVFKTPQTEQQMSQPIVRDMAASGVKTAAYIGFNDAYGEGWARAFEAAAREAGIQVVASERFARTDTSVAGQILRILSRNPDAVLIGGSGTAPVLPQRTLRERGYRGLIYQTHGVANPDFLRVGGDVVVGTRLPAGPVLVFDQLPPDFPNRQVATSYVQQYESRFGIGSYSTFGGHAYDAWAILRPALERALRREQTTNLAAFRRVLRDELEATRSVVGTHGIFNMSPTDHLGLRFNEAAVMVEIVKTPAGKLDWKLLRTFR